MKKHFYSLFLLIGLWSCMPTEIKVPDSAKPVDNYSRQFISYVIDGQIENAMNMMSPEAQNTKTRELLTNTNLNLNYESVKKITTAEYNYSKIISNKDKITGYRMAYEYSFEKGNALLLITLREKDGKLTISNFNGEFLKAPLSELNQFSFSAKSFIHYIFFFFCIFIPLSIIVTFIIMLCEKRAVSKKILWAFIILLVSFPKFTMNWGTGDIGFNLISISLLGAGFSLANLYSAWILSFSLPVGAASYWLKRWDRKQKELKAGMKAESENENEK